MTLVTHRDGPIGPARYTAEQTRTRRKRDTRGPLAAVRRTRGRWRHRLRHSLRLRADSDSRGYPAPTELYKMQQSTSFTKSCFFLILLMIVDSCSRTRFVIKKTFSTKVQYAALFLKFQKACKPRSRISINCPSELRQSRHHLIPHFSIHEEIHVWIDQILLHKTRRNDGASIDLEFSPVCSRLTTIEYTTRCIQTCIQCNTLFSATSEISSVCLEGMDTTAGSHRKSKDERRNSYCTSFAS